ncbi:MAG: 16S rRNA (adenine(1518)-N(6)/adenine(1519)-N(6))-dimethyltransferase RsmA [Candidatus Asgardarchaeia archaeon]
MTRDLFERTLFLIKKYGIFPKRELSQHFLISSHFLNKLLEYADIHPSETVLEIGSGLGTITEQIARNAKRVIAIEVDPVLVNLLKSEISYENVDIVNADIIKWKTNISLDKIISNVPYNISSKLLLKLFMFNFKKAILVFQKDFVDKVSAPPGTEKYGFISAISNLLYFVDILDTIPPDAYFPRPKVFSVITCIKKNSNLKLNESDFNLLLSLMRTLFSRKHKKLNSILRTLIKKNKLSSEILQEIPFNLLQKRPFMLDRDDLTLLYNLIGRAF